MQLTVRYVTVILLTWAIYYRVSNRFPFNVDRPQLTVSYVMSRNYDLVNYADGSPVVPIVWPSLTAPPPPPAVPERRRRVPRHRLRRLQRPPPDDDGALRAGHHRDAERAELGVGEPVPAADAAMAEHLADRRHRALHVAPLHDPLCGHLVGEWGMLTGGGGRRGRCCCRSLVMESLVVLIKFSCEWFMLLSLF